MTEDEFRANATERRFSQPIRKTWESGRLNDGHIHESALYLRIETGVMVLGLETASGTITTTLTTGGTIIVPAGCHHFEQAGPNGVTFLVASK